MSDINYRCIFCGFQCNDLAELKSHSAVCASHPQAKKAAECRDRFDCLLTALETVRTHSDTPEALARYLGDAVRKARDMGASKGGTADPADSGEPPGGHSDSAVVP